MRELIEDFWSWRVVQQPRTSDDIPRVERPAGWTPDLSAAAVARYRRELDDFERRWAAARPDDSDRADAVDHRLIGSAIARVRWELDVLRTWERDPAFYVDQTVGVVFDLLTVPALDAARLDDVRIALEAAPRILADGRANLATTGYREFAELAVAQLGTVDADLAATAGALALLDVAGWTDADREALTAAARTAGRALVEFRSWLAEVGSSLPPAEPVGREDFEWFLRTVALLPYSASDLATIGRMEADRAVFLEMLERRRNDSPAGGAPEVRFADAAAQSAAEVEAETEVREFYVRKGLLSQPDYLRPYHTHLIPDFLAPIAWAGTADDLTGPSRLGPGRRGVLPRTVGRAALLLRRERARPAGRRRPRGCALPAADDLLAARAPGPALVLRLLPQRGHRLLQRGDDARRRTLRRRPAVPRDHLQLHAAAGAAGGGRRAARDRGVRHPGGRRLPGARGPDGRRDGCARGGVLRVDPGSGHDLPGRQDADPAPAGRRQGERWPGLRPAGLPRPALAGGQRPLALQRWELLDDASELDALDAR